MTARILCFIAATMISLSALSVPDSLSNGKALNFPFRKYGISFGNSHEFTGIRLNFADSEVRRINGLNITLWIASIPYDANHNNENAVVNGVSIGTFIFNRQMQPLNIGLANVAKGLNGLTVSGLFTVSPGEKGINGCCLSGIWTALNNEGSTMNGLALSGLGLSGGRSLNGLAFAGFGVKTNAINGIAMSLAYLSVKYNFRGAGITPGYLLVDNFAGISVAGYSKIFEMHGLSIAVFNRTNELHGVQLGFLNYAGNNPVGLRLLPIFNVHFR